MKFKMLSIVLASLSIVSLSSADLDWVGGQTQFRDAEGQLIGPTSGVAVLLSVAAGEPIHFDTFKPAAPRDLLTPGAVLNDGGNVNRVLAVSSEFYSGYLLNSAIPDLSVAEQEALGATPDEPLFVMVWDRQTFRSGLPIDDSRYTLVPLWLDGDSMLSAKTLHKSVSIFADVVYPVGSLERELLSQAAMFAGFNTFSGFTDWAYQKFGMIESPELRTSDPDGDGRSLFEEYVFAERPSVQAGVDEHSRFEAPVRAVAHLRASDVGIQYAVRVSSNLNDWAYCPLEYAENGWRSLSEEIQVVENHYKGEGVWSVSVEPTDPSASSRFFKFESLEL